MVTRHTASYDSTTQTPEPRSRKSQDGRLQGHFAAARFNLSHCLFPLLALLLLKALPAPSVGVCEGRSMRLLQCTIGAFGVCVPQTVSRRTIGAPMNPPSQTSEVRSELGPRCPACSSQRAAPPKRRAVRGLGKRRLRTSPEGPGRLGTSTEGNPRQGHLYSAKVQEQRWKRALCGGKKWPPWWTNSAESFCCKFVAARIANRKLSAVRSLSYTNVQTNSLPYI